MSIFIIVCATLIPKEMFTNWYKIKRQLINIRMRRSPNLRKRFIMQILTSSHFFHHYNAMTHPALCFSVLINTWWPTCSILWTCGFFLFTRLKNLWQAFRGHQRTQNEISRRLWMISKMGSKERLKRSFISGINVFIKKIGIFWFPLRKSVQTQETFFMIWLKMCKKQSLLYCPTLYNFKH